MGSKKVLLLPLLLLSIGGCIHGDGGYPTFAEYPGFEEYYNGRCSVVEDRPVDSHDRELLERFRPRLVLPPGGRYPIDFYRDYLPYTVLRNYPSKTVVEERVTPEILGRVQRDLRYYLDLQWDRFQSAGLDRRIGVDENLPSPANWRPAIYGRVYRERVAFPDGEGNSHPRDFTFLKYNAVFPISGLPARLPRGMEGFVKGLGLDPKDWHELDIFTAVHVVLNGEEKPIAVILSQHNHHRTYLAGRDIPLPEDGRMVFDIALRSNEIYPDSDGDEPVRHRVAPWALYMKYLLSGESPPFLRGQDITYGLRAGGRAVDYDLAFLSPCDPFYTAKIMLGEWRPFLKWYVGRDGPPGADYYTVPDLLLLGRLLQFSYLRDGDPEDIRFVDQAIDVKDRKIDFRQMIEYGGRRLYRDLPR